MASDTGTALVNSLTGLGGRPGGPLSVTYPSPMMLVHYPLFAANVRLLCDKDSHKSRAGATLATTIYSMRSTYRDEGLVGLYRGGHLYLLHQATRDVLRLLAERGMRLVERRFAPPGTAAAGAAAGKGAGRAAASSAGSGREPGELGEEVDAVAVRRSHRRRLAAKYLIDAMCYPLLLVSTRVIILHSDPRNSWQQMNSWREEEGTLSLLSGLTASLLSTALEEVMEWVLAACIDYCATGTEMELSDKMLLKASGSSVVSILTAPVNYVGVIQRCQSCVPGLLPPEPLGKLVLSLPWRGSIYQFVLFGGIMALNVRLIQWKIQLQNEPDGE